MDFSRYNILANDIRKMIIEAAFTAGKNNAHVGGSLSMVEILIALYFFFVKRDENNLNERDRIILSKAHASLALYCILIKKGLLPENALESFEQNGSKYTVHARREIEKGLEFSGGSLGLGCSYGIGVALALKERKSSSHVYIILGDGECNEGIVWESLMFAKHHNLDNLTIIVDRNHLQADGDTEKIIDTSSLEDKFKAFGFYSRKVNGHSIEDLVEALSSRKAGMPNAIIAETIKGKGVSFIENKSQWHFSYLSENRYKKALSELNNKS